MIRFPDQQFHWTEPFAFARARAATAPLTHRLKIAIVLSVLFSVPMLIVNFPKDATDLAIAVASGMIPGFLLIYVLIPLASLLPRDVLVTSKSIGFGRGALPFTDIQYAAVDTALMGGTEYPVLRITTKAGQQQLYGLGRKVDARELAAFFRKSGLREPPA